MDYVHVEDLSILNEKDLVKFTGMECGRMILTRKGREYVLIHTAGHSYWSGIGMQGYAIANYKIYKIVEKDQFGRDTLEEVKGCTFYSTKKDKFKARNKALKMFEKLESHK